MTAISIETTAETAAREGELREVGRAFLVALRSRDWDQFESLLHPRARMRSLLWDGHYDFTGRAEIVAVFHHWYGDAQTFEPLSADVSIVGERLSARYHFRLQRPGAAGPEEIEQVVYFQIRNGRILSLDLICSGFRPARSSTANPRPTELPMAAAVVA